MLGVDGGFRPGPRPFSFVAQMTIDDRRDALTDAHGAGQVPSTVHKHRPGMIC